MPLALFVILGLAALALVVGRMSATSFGGAVQQGISSQSYLAARSGAEIALHRLLFDRQQISETQAVCTALDAEAFEFDVPGLDQCSAAVQCRTLAAANDILNLEVSSTGRCGAKSLNASRAIAYRIQIRGRDVISGQVLSGEPVGDPEIGDGSIFDPRIVFKQELMR